MLSFDMTTPNHGITLATKVTLLRILGVPVFVLLLVYYTMNLKAGIVREDQRLLALVVFVLVAATDALDGYLARSRNEITDLGRVLDPLADKALLLAGLVMLTRPSLPNLEPHIPIWFTTLVISRDVIQIAGYFIIHHFAGAVVVRPRWIGKIASVLQMGVIVWVLLQAVHPSFHYFVALAGVLTGVAFLQYVIDGARQLGHSGRH